MAKLTLKDIGNKLKEKLQQGATSFAQTLPPVQAYNAVKTLAPTWQRNVSQAMQTPIPQKYQPAAQKFLNFTNKISRPMDVATQGFTGGMTWGLGKLPNVQEPQTNLEKAAYGVGYGVGMFNPLNPITKVAGAIKPAFGGVQKVLGSQAGKLISQGGVTKLAGRGLANLSQGLPYTGAYALARGVSGQGEVGRGIATDIGADLALGSLPFVGGLLIGSGGGINKKLKTLAEPFAKDLQKQIGRPGREFIPTSMEVNKLKFNDFDLQNATRDVIEKAKEKMKGGILEPIVVDKSGMILDGTHRTIAAKELGIKELPVVVQFEGEIKKQQEDIRNLIAQHNIKPGGVLHAEKMGGLPLPSLAVSRKEYPLEGFGDISLLANKELIDPKIKSNKVFNADAYSPRYPTVNYSYKDKEADEILTPIIEKTRNYFKGNRAVDPGYLDNYGKPYRAILDAGEFDRKGIDAIENNSVIKGSFAMEKGISPDVDYQQINEVIQKNRDEFSEYVKKITNKISGEERLFKGFTYSGNRIYKPHTLDNVVKAMKADMKEGEGFNYGVGTLRSKVAKKYRTLSQIKEDRNKIVSSEEMEKIKDQLDNEYFKLLEKHGVEDISNFTSIYADYLAGNIRRSELSQYEASKNVDFSDFDKFAQKLRDVETEYFEVKPQRAVSLNEFKVATVPDNTPNNVLESLKKQGLKIYTYGKDNRADVIRKAAEDNDLAFSMVAGMEPYQDEDGNWKIRFNETNALLGIAAVGGVKAIKRKIPQSTKGVEPVRIKMKGIDELLDKAGNSNFEVELKRKYADYIRAMERGNFSPPTAGPNKGKQVIDENLAFKWAMRDAMTVPSGNLTKGVESMPSVMKRPESPKVEGETLSLKKTLQSRPLLSQIPQKPNIGIKQSGQALEDIIAQGRKQIGGKIDEPKVSFKQSMDSLYTQWVDRFNPIVQASQKAKGTLKLKGATLRPEYDPEYLVRRLTGAGGIADNQFKTQLEPIIKQVEDAGIPKIDLDTYLANKRIAGFGKVNRDIYGADPVKAGQIVNALETKYPNIGQFADQLYSYQNKGFQEMVDAGFISPENAKIIQGQNPDYAPLKRVMDEVSDYLGLPTRKTMQGSQPITKIKGSTRQIESPLESIIGNTFSQRAAIEKNRVAKAIVGLQNIVGDMGFTKVPKSDVDTITIWNNGQKEYWKVGKEIADVAKGVNEEQMNLVLKVLQAPAALLRQGATGRNPEFMIPNIIRDQLDAGVTSKYGYIPFVDYVSGLKSMIANDEIYQKWANSGAKIDLGEMSGKKSINTYFDTATKKKGLFNWLGGVLDTMGKYSEQPTRVGLFKKAYKKTGNDLIAALESRDATVDFARMGSKMKVANSIIPFLNVGVQGFDKLIRSVKSNPAKVLFNATLYGTAPAIATTVYNLANYPKEYSEIPQYEKDSNFVLVTGRNKNGTVDYLTFPKGNVLPTIANPVQSFIDYLYGNDQQSFKQMALQTISSTLPVVGDGSSLGEIATKTIGSNIPQLFKPAAENILNKSFYKYDPKKEQTKEIVPYYLQSKQPYEQTYKFTPQMYQKIGAILNVSPLKVQNLMEGYLAGYSKIPAQIIEVATKASNNEEISPNEKTILRRFIKQTYSTSGTKKVESKPETPSIMERLGMAPKAAEVPENIITYKKGNKEYEVDLNKTFNYPTIDTTTALGKEAISRYKSEISSQVNKIYDAYQDGKISEQDASNYINQLSIAYDRTKKPKKAKAPKKITLKVSSYKAPKINIKKRSFKMPSIKIKKPKKIKIVRKYTIK